MAPIIYAIPVQLLAYHAAVVKGTDVDQPRNLAKCDCGIVSSVGVIHPLMTLMCSLFRDGLATRNLIVAPYSDYQTELHDIIQTLHDEVGYRKIAQC